MQTFTQLGNTFPVLKPIIGFINQLLGALRELFIVFNNPKAGKGKGISDFISKVFMILLDAMVFAIDIIIKYVPKIIGFLIDFVTEKLIPALINLLPKLLDSISNTIDELIKKYPKLETWLKPVKWVIDTLSDFFKNIDTSKLDFSFIMDFIEGLGKITSYIRQAIFSILKTVWDALGGEEGIKKMFNDFVTFASNIFNDIKGFINDLIPYIKMIIPIFNKIINMFISLSKWVFEKLMIILPPVIKVFLWLIKTIVKLLLPVILWIVDVLLDFAGIIAKVIGGIIDFGIAVVKFIVDIWEWWQKFDIMKWLSDLGESISKWFSDTIKSITDWWDNLDLMTPIKNIGLMILGIFSDLGQGIYDEFIKPLIDMWDDFIGFFKNVKLPDWLTGMGGGTDESELRRGYNNSNPSSIASTQNTFEDLQQQRAEAEKRYLKSSEFYKDMSLYKRKEAESMSRLNIFDTTTTQLAKDINTSLSKNPVKVEVKATSNAKVEIPPPKAPNMTQAYSSLDSFFNTVSNIFFAISRQVKLLFSSDKLGVNIGLTKLQQSKYFDFSNLNEGNKALFTFMEDNEEFKKKYSALYDGKVSNFTDEDIKDALKGTGGDTNPQLIDALKNLMVYMKQSKTPPPTDNIYNILASRLPTIGKGKNK
jgi:hypothetical protein